MVLLAVVAAHDPPLSPAVQREAAAMVASTAAAAAMPVLVPVSVSSSPHHRPDTTAMTSFPAFPCWSPAILTCVWGECDDGGGVFEDTPSSRGPQPRQR